jgi:hypothetical protein
MSRDVEETMNGDEWFYSKMPGQREEQERREE